MPLFEKVVAEAGDSPGDLKDLLSKKLRDKKLAEMDEATVERQVQAEQTKTAELSARQTEAEVRKTTAEMSIADKMVPQGMWAVITELLKDRNPNQPMTVQDMLAIMEYARQQQGGGDQDQPPEGMWGFLTAMIANMSGHNQTTTPMELIQLIQTVSSMQHGQQQQQHSPTSQLMEMVQAFTAMKSLFAPPAPQMPAGTTLAMPGGGAIPLNDFMTFQNHSFNLEMKKIDHLEKIENYRTAREMAPGVLPAIAELAQAIRSGGGNKPPAEKQLKEGRQPKKDQLPPPQGMQDVECPDCHLQFSVPAALDLNKVDITCPVCAMIALRTKEGADVQKYSQDNGQEQGAG